MRQFINYIRRVSNYPPVLFVAIIAAFCPCNATAANGPIADPKKWCGDAAEMIANGAIDKFFDAFVFAGGGLVDRPTVAQGFSSLQPFLARVGGSRSQDFLRETDYENAFSRVWYLVQFDRGVLFLRCEAARYGDAWILTSFSYDSNSEKVGLP